MLSEFRFQTNFDSIENCIDNLNAKSKKKIKTEFITLLNKTA